MAISDLATNPILATSASFAGFNAPDPFPHDIYSFVISAIRQCDRDVGDLLLLRFVEAAQSEFEDTYARVESLRDLHDPERCPAAALKHLKWIVGLTSKLDELTGNLTEDELRILISIAVKLWKVKGTDAGLALAAGVFSTYPVRILNYFLFRIIVGEVEIAREELNVDPWLIDEAGLSPSELPAAVAEIAGPPARIKLDLTPVLGATEAVPHAIRVQYVPDKVTEFAESQWDGSANVVYSAGLMGQTSPVSTTLNDYRVGVDPDEFVSDLRVVDDGTGVLNRDLLENLIRTLRGSSERINVRYLDFQDTFRDALFWTVPAGVAVHTPASGIIELGDAAEAEIVTDFPIDSTWTEIHAAVQFKQRDATAGEWSEVRFYRTDSLNFYAVRLDPATRVVSLDRVTAGVRTTLDSVTLLNYHVGLFYVISVQTEDTGAGHQLRYLLDNNVLGTVVDSDHTAGKLGVASAVGQLTTVTFADLFQNPLQSTRIGP